MTPHPFHYPMLNVKQLKASIADTPILDGLSLVVKPGEIHALMGQNGSGKSTFAHVLAGHPAYTVTDGSVALEGADLLEMDPEARAAAGLFLAFQYPMSIPGVPVAKFLRQAKNAQRKTRGETPLALAPFLKELKVAMKQLAMPWSFAERAVNDGFSGGEKKRLEMLQMLILKPRLVVLDEIDSGLDIDAIKVVADAVHILRAEQPETAVVLITHYQRLLNHITPNFVHIVAGGKIVRSGGAELAHELEAKGYADLEKKIGQAK